ncbi:MAG: hypothetical protein ABWY35_02305 [Pseudorhodoplanes sp.]
MIPADWASWVVCAGGEPHCSAVYLRLVFRPRRWFGDAWRNRFAPLQKFWSAAERPDMLKSGVASDVFADAGALTRDLGLIESLQWFRKEFFDRLCRASTTSEPDVVFVLRMEAAYQLAEFFYLLRAHAIATEEQMRMFAQMHNQYIVDLTKDEVKMERLGLKADRLLDSMFTSDTLPRLLHHWAEKPGTFDQSNLARFLAVLMSTETCRKVVVACERAGFLTRVRSPHGAVLVQSNGGLEALFGQCLRDLRGRLER